ncbi:endonuclease/exonuclease/phosphatase family protein [Micromonospora sp. BRA006-A]|nr:endonuclease/exonuclease/phosphatase family protein [Micromonospora sp. BRA006-A]
MRLATWNVNSVKARLPRLLDWLATTEPDVVCLQETKCPDGAFPVAEVGELGYEVASHSDGRWNGVAVLSRVGLADVAVGFPVNPGSPIPRPAPSRPPATGCGSGRSTYPTAARRTTRTTRTSWPGSRRCATPWNRRWPAPAGGRLRGLQRGAHRRGRLGSDAVRHLHPRHPGRAGRPGRAA